MGKKVLQLKVRNFSVLKEIEVEVGDLLILTGSPAAGKSLISKLIFFFVNEVSRIYKEMIEEKLEDIPVQVLKANGEGGEVGRTMKRVNFKNEFKSRIKEAFLEFFPPNLWGGEGFVITWSIAESEQPQHGKGGQLQELLSLRGAPPAPKKREKLEIRVSDSYSNYWQRIRKDYTDILKKSVRKRSAGKPRESGSSMFIFPDELIYLESKRGLSPPYLGEGIFIPAGRTFYVAFSQNIFPLLYLGAKVDKFLSHFGGFFRRALSTARGSFLLYAFREKSSKEDAERAQRVRMQILQILKDLELRILHSKFSVLQKPIKVAGSYYKHVFHTQDSVIPIEFGSSGQQESLPVVLAMRDLLLHPSEFENFGNKNSRFLMVEEPEAHLAPAEQKAITQLILLPFTRAEWRTILPSLHVVVTTHSPYILASLNIQKLRLRWKMLAKNGADQSGDADRETNVDFEMSAYLIKEGRSKKIINSCGLIDAVDFDSAADEIEEELLELLDEVDCSD